MKTKILLPILLLLSFSGTSQNVEWAKSAPYSSYVTWTNIIVHDNSNNSYMSGHYNMGGSAWGIFIIKYDQYGNKLWENIYQGNYVSSMCTDSLGNLYATFFAYTVNGVNYNTNHGMLFAKYDANGTLTWIKHIPYCLWVSEHPDSQGNLIVNGYITGEMQDTVRLENGVTLTCTPDGVEYFIGRYNTNGECLWAIPNEGGNHLLIPNNSSQTVLQTEIMGQTITLGKGANQVTLPSTSDGYIAKYQANGELGWVKLIVTCGVAIDDAGYVYSFDPDLSDYTHDSNKNIYLSKYDLNGDLLWKRTHLYLDDGYKFAMKAGANGALYITGGFRNYMAINDTTITGGNDYRMFVAKIDSSGTLKWITTSTGPGGAGAKDLTVSGNEIIVTGDMGGEQAFGNFTVNEPNGGVFTVKITDDKLQAVSVKDIAAPSSSFTIYPNPSSTNINIVYNSSSRIEHLKIEIKNTLGQVIYSNESVSINNEFKRSIDLSRQNKGIYFIEIIADKKREVKRIVLE